MASYLGVGLTQSSVLTVVALGVAAVAFGTVVPWWVWPALVLAGLQVDAWTDDPDDDQEVHP